MDPEEFDWSLGSEEPEGETTSDESGADQPDAQPDDGAAGQRQRDDRGRFVTAQQEPGDSEAVDEAQAGQEAGEVETDQDGLILGKFRTREDLERAYLNLEQHQGRQSSELGDLRKQVDHLSQAMSEPEYAPVDEGTVNALDELSAENPEQAALWALQHQPMLYDRVIDNWYQADPRSATRFETRLHMAQIRNEIQDTITPALQPLQKTAQEQQFARAWGNVSTKYPGMEGVADKMMEAAEAAPEIAAALQNGDIGKQERLIENLYWLARGREADTLTAAATDLGRQQATETIQDKLDATVASASSTPARGEKSSVDRWKEQLLEPEPTSIASALDALRSAS